MAEQRKRTRTRTRQVGTEATTRQRREGSDVLSESESHNTTYHSIAGESARVRVEGSITQNMGDFNSVRVGVMIERPCANTDEAISETYDQVSEQVDEYLNNELDMAINGADE